MTSGPALRRASGLLHLVKVAVSTDGLYDDTAVDSRVAPAVDSAEPSRYDPRK